MEEKKIYISTAGATTGYCEFHCLREIQRVARLLEEELRQMGQHYGDYDDVTVIVINAIEKANLPGAFCSKIQSRRHCENPVPA